MELSSRTKEKQGQAKRRISFGRKAMVALWLEVAIGNFCQLRYNGNIGSPLASKGSWSTGMTTKNISLTEHYSELVDTLVASGKYKNASEVVREGLRLLEQRTTEDNHRLELLRQLATEGFRQLDQGGGVGLRTSGQVATHIAKLGRQAAKQAKNRKSG